MILPETNCAAPGCTRPAEVTASEHGPPLCARHFAAHLERQKNPPLICRAADCREPAYPPDQLCLYHRSNARRRGIPYSAPADFFPPPRYPRTPLLERPNTQILWVRVTAYAGHILALVGRAQRPKRTTEEQAMAALEEWAEMHRPRGGI